jgi:uncharacterized cupredoxin-like copper-binding protein
VLLAGLSTGHLIGLTVVAAIFIAFALGSSFLAPRYRPDFPGRAGLSVFVIASFVLFAGMLTAVELFGGESETATAAEQPSTAPTSAARATFSVQEKEFTIVLPAAAKQSLQPGTYTFQVHNAGTTEHDLAVQGEGTTAIEKTPLIKPGSDASLTVTLAKGVYDLFCTVPGHRQAGMEAKITVA